MSVVAREIWLMLRTAADSVVRARLSLAALFAILSAVLSGLAPVMLRQLVDDLTAGASATAIMMVLAFYASALGCVRLAEQARALMFALGDQHLQRRLNAGAYRRFLALPMRFHIEHAIGGVIQAHAQALQGLRILLTHAGFTILPALVQIVVILTIVSGAFNAAIWSALALTMASYGAAFALGVRSALPYTRTALASQVAASTMFADGLANIEAVKAATAETLLAGEYDTLLEDGERRWQASHFQRFRTSLAVISIFAGGLVTVLWLGASAVISGDASVGDFVLLNAYVLQLIGPLEQTGFAIRDLAQSAAYMDKWLEIQRIEPEPLLATPVRVKRPAPPEIRFENVSFGYASDPILTGVDFVVPAGGFAAIVGASGVGKSTLLRLLQRHCTPWSGNIRLYGSLIEDFDLPSLRSLIAVVSQDTVLFNDTLRRNLLFTRPDADDELLGRAIAAARLDPVIERLPAGLESQVGERGQKLSGGEKQRVALARAILRDAPILLLDEATSSLDAATEQAIAASLSEQSPTRTTLLVTHRLFLATRADRIFLLEGGRIAEAGPHAKLLRQNGAYARLWRSQVAG